MSVLSEQTRERIRAEFSKYPNKRAATLPALHIVQDEHRQISTEALREIGVDDTRDFFAQRELAREGFAGRRDAAGVGSRDLQGGIEGVDAGRRAGHRRLGGFDRPALAGAAGERKLNGRRALRCGSAGSHLPRCGSRDEEDTNERPPQDSGLPKAIAVR